MSNLVRSVISIDLNASCLRSKTITVRKSKYVDESIHVSRRK